MLRRYYDYPGLSAKCTKVCDECVECTISKIIIHQYFSEIFNQRRVLDRHIEPYHVSPEVERVPEPLDAPTFPCNAELEPQEIFDLIIPSLNAVAHQEAITAQQQIKELNESVNQAMTLNTQNAVRIVELQLPSASP